MKKVLIILFVSLLILLGAIGGAVLYTAYQDRLEQEAAEAEYQKLQEQKRLEQEAAEEAEPVNVEISDPDEYTFKEMDETFFAVEDGVEVRDDANNDGELIGTLSLDQSVSVVGQCDQTSYYKIKINGDYGYVAQEGLSQEYIDIPIPVSGDVAVPSSTKEILFIGNSITCYPATADWWGNGWGCGASTKENDYVHLTVAAKGYGSYDAMSMRNWEFSKTRNRELPELDSYISKNQYNIVVIELGENARGNSAHLKKDLVDMVTYIKKYSPNARFIFMDNFWKFDDVISAKKAAASEVGATYVSLSDLWNVKDYQLQSGDTFIGPDQTEYVVNDFLAGHPNDAGFAAMAERLIPAL